MASGMAGSSKVGNHTRRIERLSARRTHSIPNRKHESHGAGRRMAALGLSTTKQPRNGPSTCRVCLRASRPALGRFSAPNRQRAYRRGWMSWRGATILAVSLLTPALHSQERTPDAFEVVQASTANFYVWNDSFRFPIAPRSATHGNKLKNFRFAFEARRGRRGWYCFADRPRFTWLCVFMQCNLLHCTNLRSPPGIVVLQLWWKRLAWPERNPMGLRSASVKDGPLLVANFLDPVEKNFRLLQADAFADGADNFPTLVR